MSMPQRGRRWSGAAAAAAAVCLTAVFGSGPAASAFSPASRTGSCASPGQKLANADFELGRVAWTDSTGVIGQWAQEPALSGTWNAFLDGHGTVHTDTLSQTVTLPAGCSVATLRFWLHIDTFETTTVNAYDKLTVQVNTTTLATYSNLNKATGYAQKTFNLAAFAGQTVTVRFTGTEDSSLQTSFAVDETALTVS
ncbi:hypothetical protein [Dactylosporangium sp. CA-233914]|uniref:hypothetical protein n=1 Tax=Dactylosporangium sp. CA-233914 TaxID=3239934 RepID=UPI003D8C6357